MDYVRAERQVSIRLACRVVGISRSLYRYKPDRHRDNDVIQALQDAVNRYPSHGFGKLFTIMRRSGCTFNHKRVHRVYRLLNLNKRRRGKKRIPTGTRLGFNYLKQSMSAGRWML